MTVLQDNILKQNISLLLVAIFSTIKWRKEKISAEREW
jgi:hypothetical protein